MAEEWGGDICKSLWCSTKYMLALLVAIISNHLLIHYMSGPSCYCIRGIGWIQQYLCTAFCYHTKIYIDAGLKQARLEWHLDGSHGLGT